MIAAGSDEPLHFGIDPEKLKLNSRVDVFLLDELTDGLTGTADEREDRLIDIPQAGDSP
jgi:hypothetical protein